MASGLVMLLPNASRAFPSKRYPMGTAMPWTTEPQVPNAINNQSLASAYLRSLRNGNGFVLDAGDDEGVALPVSVTSSALVSGSIGDLRR